MTDCSVNYAKKQCIGDIDDLYAGYEIPPECPRKIYTLYHNERQPLILKISDDFSVFSEIWFFVLCLSLRK